MSSSTPTAEPRNLFRLWVCVTIGLALWFVPPPEGLTVQAWRIAAVFGATILGFLLRPLAMGPCVLLGLVVLAASGELDPYKELGARGPRLAQLRRTDVFEILQEIEGQDFVEHIDRQDILVTRGRPKDRLQVIERQTLDPKHQLKRSFEYSLSGFADTTAWLVVAAFLISGAMIRTGLGRRVALSMVSLFGRTTLGLGYAIGAAELCLAPFVPSNTARGGGVMAPIVNSLSHVLGSTAEENPNRAGRYLVLCGAHANLVTAAMFLTGMAANPLVNTAARDVFQTELSWAQWLLGGLVPGLVSLAVLPLVLYRLAPPEATAAGAAREKARDDLAAMGGWTAKQRVMAAVLVGMLALWITTPLQTQWWGYSLPTALVAVIGVTVLVVLGVESWRDITGNWAAWDALIWLGGLITMATALRDSGFTAWFAESVGQYTTGLPPVPLAVTLAVVYFFSMYAFSMLTGHIMAFAGVFFAVAAAAGAPPLLMVALIAYFSNLCGCTTNYSTGPVVIYYGLGYVPAPKWFAVGFVVALVHLAVWLGVGLPYWKLLGWW